MEFITYTKAEIVNIKAMDEQHEQMTKIINKLYIAFNFKKNATVKVQLKILAEHLRSHFDYEEAMMKQTKFAGYISHKLEHDRFYKNILNILQSYIDNKPILTIEVFNNMKSWFFNHIEISDRKCGKHFEKSGIK